MKRTIGVALVCLMAACAQAQSWKKEKAVEKSKGFIENFAKAQKEAGELKQPIFALFTGSDWCPWCVKLHDEVLETKEFKKFAEDNLVLFEADFPRTKDQPSDVKKQNKELSSKYGIQGFPTVLVLDAEGKQLGQTGYQAGGGEAYVKSLKTMLEKAGVTVTDKPAAGKAVSAYDKMKASKATDKAAPAQEKK